jgi:2-C-methyl-D-erythritol 4-phosphate cytidylyltransferase
VGGLLGVPVRDTMKRADEDGRVACTEPRAGLWHALTPQMFRLKLLQASLQRALDQGVSVTDESSAIELAGRVPRLIEGHADNIKITRPEDLALAEFYLQQREAAL